MLGTLQNMKNKYLLFALVGIVFLLSPIPASAQFKKEKKSQSRYQKSKDSVNSILSSIKYSTDTAKVSRQISNWQDILIPQQNNELDTLSANIDKVKDELKLCSSVDSLRTIISSQRGCIDTLEADLTYLEIYKQISSYEANLELLNKEYSVIRSDDLSAIDNSVDLFIYRDDFETYEYRVAATIRNFELYTEAKEAINKWCSVSQLDTIYNRLDLLLSRDLQLTEGQKTELTEMRKKVSRYKNGIEALNAIVEEVNSNEDVRRFRDNVDKESLGKAIEQIANSNDMKYKYDRYFKTVPYLDTLITNYWKDLGRNPFKSPSVEEQIKEWK